MSSLKSDIMSIVHFSLGLMSDQVNLILLTF